jgi:hypothetical protein
MDQHTLVNSIIIISMEKVFILGQIIESMRVNGRQTKCTVKVLSLGQMEENISVNIVKTKRKDMENSSGQMGDAIEESGLMANNMAKELI